MTQSYYTNKSFIIIARDYSNQLMLFSENQSCFHGSFDGFISFHLKMLCLKFIFE